MLRECFRVLKPGGTIRISAPDLRVLVGLFSDDKTTDQEFYIDWMTDKFVPGADFCKEVFLINNAFVRGVTSFSTIAKHSKER